MSGEIWRLVPGYEDYSISNMGSVRRIVPARRAPVGPLKPWKTSAGYPVVSLWRKNAKGAAKLYVHHLVARLFLPIKPTPKHEVAHNNGDAGNPAASNLRWASKSDNEMDKVSHGTSNRGSRHGLAKLTEADVIAIRSSGESCSVVAKGFGVSREHIRDIRARKRWAHL